MRDIISYGGFSGTGSQTIKFSEPGSQICISNDGSGEMKFSLGTSPGGADYYFFNDMVLLPGEIFDEWVPPFTQIKIEASGP
ncbi:hypothetical protein, partial [Paenibacillus ehimensis]